MTKLFHSVPFNGMQELSSKLNEMLSYCSTVNFINISIEVNGPLQQQKAVAFIEVVFNPESEFQTPANFCDKFNIPKTAFL